MKKNYKQAIILILILLCINIVRVVYATNSEKISVTSWDSLKNVIESNDKLKIEIQLSNEKSNTWTADSKITIPSGKTVTLIANSSITIKRGKSFLDNMIENEGILDVMTSSSAINIILDGNKENVQATGALINVNNGKLNICNTILQNNNKNGYGGAIYASDAELELANVTLSDNEANYGGAIFVLSEESKTNLNDIKVINNKAKTGSGGGIYAYGNLVISGKETLISNNIAQTFGGGLMIKTNGILNEGEISKNQAISNAGGGIRVDKRFTYNGGDIKENIAGTTGGGIDFSNGIFDKKANNVFNNIATEDGNDIYPILENNLDWTEDENLKLRKININLWKTYVKNEDIVSRNTQGMTVTDKYVLFTLWKSDDDTTMIAIADKNTGEILNIVDGYNFKHANDMTYDSKNDYIYILTSSKKIAKFKINAQYQITDLQYVTCNREYSGIVYNQDDDGFVGLAGKKVYVTNNKFEEQYFFDVPTNLTTQGIGYYEGNIYYCCTENGVPSQYQPIYNNKERLSNLIYKYNLKGELVETLYIPNTTLYGEIEGCAFEDDGTLVASYNVNFGAKATVSLYKSNIIPPALEVLYNVTELTNKDVSVRINSNKELQEVSGWTLLENKKSLIRTYSSNIQEEVIVKDLFDNSSVATINITNIDKEKPILELNTEVTTTIIKVQVSASDTDSGINEHSYKYYIRKENGTYGEAVPDGYAHTFNQLSSNQEYDIKVEVSDNVGNIGSKEIQITTKKSNKVTSTTYKIDEEKLIIKEIQPNTKIGEIKDKIQGDIEYKIINSKGETVLDTPKIGTGYKLKLEDDKEYTLVVTGDSNGDGDADIKDILAINKHRLNKASLEMEYSLAGDVNGDGKADIRDILQINKFRFGKVAEL